MQTRSVRLRLALVLGFASLAACGPGDTASSAEAVSVATLDGHPEKITVMTRNLYVGADLFEPFGAPDPLLAASNVFSQILASEIPGRMAAIADEIWASRSDIVGLQEAFRFEVTPLGTTTPSHVIDYLDLLEDALAATPGPRSYLRAVEERHAVITIPFLDQGIAVTLIDRDAILASDEVRVLGTAGDDFVNFFSTTLTTPAGVVPIDLLRGWTAATVEHEGFTFTFVNTHVETQEFGPLQSLQALELASLFGGVDPLVLVGDINSDRRYPPIEFPPGSGQFFPTPYMILSSFLDDVWPGVGRGDGFTCCFDADIMPPSRDLFERVDLVFTTGEFEPRKAQRTGLEPLASIENRWPSDHAGVVAVLRHPRGADEGAVAVEIR